MDDINDSIERVKKIFQSSMLSTHLEINTVLTVLDETPDRESFTFDLVRLLHDQTEANVVFLQAARGYLKQATELGLSFLTLPELTKAVKERFSGHSECFDISFIPEEETPPFERIEEILNTRKIDLIIITAPFTMFAMEEQQSETSLGNTIDQIISKTLIQQKIPLFLIRNALNYKLPFSKVAILTRGSVLRNDLLGWLQTLTRENAHIELFYTDDLTSEDLERVELYHQILYDWVIEENKQFKISSSNKPVQLKTFYDRASTEPDTLIIVQGIKNVADEADKLINALCFQTSNILIFPPRE